jgi:DNA modification methylase
MNQIILGDCLIKLKELDDNSVDSIVTDPPIDESRVEADIKNDPNYRPNASQHKGHGSSFSIQGDGQRSKEDLPDEGFHNSLGRFPANLIHDGSDEVRECFPEQKSGARSSKHKIGNEEGEMFNHGIYGKYKAKNYDDAPAESGSASRFFKSIIYQAKASKSERNKGCDELPIKSAGGLQGRADGSLGGEPVTAHNNHPTVKPIALMEYLIKMVTPKGGIVLDPFAGSGSTLVAAKQNGFQYIGIEMTEEYIPIIQARLDTITQQTLL